MTETPNATVSLTCDTCGKTVKPAYQDDAQTQWYKCENGHTTARPKRKQLDEIEAFQTKFCEAIFQADQQRLQILGPLSLDPRIEERLITDIDRTVKNDNHVTAAVFHIALSAYLEPGNLALKGASGAGKSYGTTETLSFFQKEDVWLIGSQSPKVITHEHGELMAGNDEPINLDEAPVKPDKRDYDDPADFSDALETYKAQRRAWDEKLKNSYHLIRLSGKILVFLEPPSRETFNMLKCTLSHDSERITHKFVDDKGRVHVAVLEGWPAAIFCSVDKEYMEEFATRVFTVTPNTDRNKIIAANEVSNLKKSYPWTYEKDTLEKQAIKALIVDIRNFVKKRNLKVINPFPNLHTCFASDVARDMRDFTHFLQLLQSYTLLKLYQRPIITIGKQEYVVTTLEDVNAAKALFDEIAETTRTGTDKRVLDFYHRYVKKHVDGATLEIIAAAYNSDSQNRKNQLGDGTIRVWLKRLNRINWVQVKKGEVVSDKRKDTFYPLKDAETQVDAPELPSKVQTKFSETTLDSQIKTDSAVNLENSQETWLKTIGENEQLKSIVILKFGDENPIQLTVEQLKQIILGQTHANSLIVSEGKMDVKSDNNDETVVKSEITPVSLNSDPCSKPVSNVSSTGSSDGGAS